MQPLTPQPKEHRTMSATRFMRPVPNAGPGGFQAFEVHDGGVLKGRVWKPGHDADTRWRSSAPNGAEWRPWRFFPSPRAAALNAVEEFDRRQADRERRTTTVEVTREATS